MTTQDRPLPPAAEAAFQLLTQNGPLSAHDLRELLRPQGYVQQIDRLLQWPDRFPHRFSVTADGRIAIANSGEKPVEEPPGPISDGDWYTANTNRTPFDRVAILDIETTGLDRATDSITEIALVRLDGSPILDLTVESPEAVTNDTATPPVPLGQALQELGEPLADVDLLIGHNLLRFDLPFIEHAARRAGVMAPRFPEAADSLHLSLLVDVAMPNRQLADLLQHYNITNSHPHRALADATATAAVVRTLLDDVDMSEPSWQLAVAILETHNHPLARLLPQLPAEPDLSALERAADPLLDPSTTHITDAWSASRDAFTHLQQKWDLKPRPAQQDMAYAVAGVFDHGGRLAVEAPTGTGKSLAYLLPALGRATRPRQPVIVATHTKALQTQLRQEAMRLQGEGLLSLDPRIGCNSCG